MKTEPNEHQKFLLDFINMSMSVFSQAAKGHVDLTNMVEIGKSIDLKKLENARDWLLKAEVRE